ncbi:DsrE family protein [Pedobacter sp. SD-b]|uniref:DsrE family protein n=1 Tax=Pedobacter segetis TaxID=2793069 RepID=A0ABS1BG47_9SPHI|nr:DsrE family protein [Pedobacter segetis]MBK0381828.1 DsrE family protein [Pedobacter segetis]
MKNLLIILLIAITVTSCKVKSKLPQSRTDFTGAKADLAGYNAIYQLDTNDPKIIDKAFRNIKNALADPRLNGKLHIELVAFSAGTDVMVKGSTYQSQLKDLLDKGVILAQCRNSLIEKGLKENSIFDFVSIVPSGNGELIIRGSQGWVIIKP